MAARIAREVDREAERKRAFAAKQGRTERGGGNAAAPFLCAVDRGRRAASVGMAENRSTRAILQAIPIGLNRSDCEESAKL
jgi:hypothetical protein